MSSIKDIANMSAAEVSRLEWRMVAQTLRRCQDMLQTSGVRHSWLDATISIAEERSKKDKNDATPRAAGEPGISHDAIIQTNAMDSSAAWFHKWLLRLSYKPVLQADVRGPIGIHLQIDTFDPNTKTGTYTLIRITD